MTKVFYFAKKGACGKPPAEENGPFPKETLFRGKKAPAAIGQPEENGFSPKNILSYHILPDPILSYPVNDFGGLRKVFSLFF